MCRTSVTGLMVVRGLETCRILPTSPGPGVLARVVSLRLKRGSFTVVTGRIGSGKTTLVEALLGVLPRDAGEVRWNGRVVDDTRSFLIPPRCAYTPQVPRVFSDTLRNNILLGLPEDDVDLQGAIRSAVLEEDVETLERGLDTLVGPRGVKLSGGQVQRTAAARMFVREPDLLVFDDLSSAWTWRLNRACGRGSMRRAMPHVLWSPTAVRSSGARTTSSSSKMARSRPRASWRPVADQRRDAAALARQRQRRSEVTLRMALLQASGSGAIGCGRRRLRVIHWAGLRVPGHGRMRKP